MGATHVTVTIRNRLRRTALGKGCFWSIRARRIASSQIS